MKKVEIYLIEFLLFISIIVFNTFIKNSYLLALSIILIGIYSIIRFGLMKDNNYSKQSISKIVISCLLAYFITIYLLGILLGFNKTPYTLNTKFIFGVVILESIVIIFEELIRYIICRNTQHKKIPLIIYTIILSILNIIIEINGFNLSDNEMIFIFISTVVLPVISREMLCSYMTYKVSYVPSIIFKLTIILYELLLPIIPQLGNYLYAVFNVGLPYMIYFFVSKTLHYKDKIKEHQKRAIIQIAFTPVLALLIILVMLVSGLFTNTIISIGSNSMKPTYSRGDAVIFKKTKPKDIKAGQILVFKKGNRIVTHRVIYVEKNEYSYRFKTQGDANNAPDAYKVEQSEVLGVVKRRIKYVGYPTLWFNDVYTGKETK